MKTIAIIDDEPAILKAFQRYLMHDFKVELYNSGADFIEHLQTADTLPDLAILDVMMPQITGYEVCRFIKTHSTYKQIKLLLCSALNSDVDIDNARKCFADDYIVKPVKKQDLFFFIELHLAQTEAPAVQTYPQLTL